MHTPTTLIPRALAVKLLLAPAPIFARASINNTGVDQALSIDNLSVTAIPEPSAFAILMGSLALGASTMTLRSNRN